MPDEDQTDDGESVLDLFNDYYHIPALAVVFTLMLWVRLQTYDAFVRDGQVVFSGNDAWYHLRQVKYTVRNWPFTMPFDPWTGFPYGTMAGQFGTLYDQLVATAALGVLVLSSTPVVALGGVAVFAAGLMAYPPVMQAYLMDSFPGDSMGGDLGAMRSVYIGIGSLGATYVGVVGQFFDYDTAFVGLMGCLLVSSTVIVFRGRE